MLSSLFSASYIVFNLGYADAVFSTLVLKSGQIRVGEGLSEVLAGRIWDGLGKGFRGLGILQFEKPT